jgi:hypothetical protein
MPEFEARLEGVEDSSATFVRVPARVVKALGGRPRVAVRMAINGVEHRTTMCDMGIGPMVGIPATVRRAAGIARGDRIAVSLVVDPNERTVEVPGDVARAMSAAERRAFDAMSYSHRKEYVLWIEDAKKPETRARRIAKAIDKLRERIIASR